MRAPVAIFVLGAKLRGGAPGAALRRRIDAAARAALEFPSALVVACGGRRWDDAVEADVIARELEARGVAPDRIVRDRLSLSTVENLREGASALRRREISGTIALVTCEWHLPRAITIARALGLEVVGRSAGASDAPLARRIAINVRERFLRALVPLLVVVALCSFAIACRRSSTSAQDGGAPLASASPSAAASDLVAARVSSDRRHAEGVPMSLASSPDVRGRRTAARALSQIGSAVAIERLGKSLSDVDLEVVAWSAYGLGLPCDVDPDLPREDRAKIVRALVARALDLEDEKGSSALDPFSAIAWSLGRCGGIDASRELARWLAKEPTRAKAAALALAAIAERDRGLEDDVAHALVEAARGGALDEAFLPFGRGDWSARPPVSGLLEVARARLSSKGPARAFAVRAYGRAPGAKVDDLRSIVADPSTPTNVLVEALRALHRIGPAGDAEIAAFATRNAPTDDGKTAALVGPIFGPLRIAVELLGERALTATTRTSLRAFVPKGNAPILAGTSAPLARRIVTLRCLAAVALHPGKPAEGDVVRCAQHDASLPAPLRAELDTLRDLARLAALDRAEITDDKRDLLLKLARDGVPRVRERALAIAAKHVEVEEAPDVLVRALAAKSLGVVAAAAQALAARPSLAHVLSKKAIEQALDPKAPPPDKVDLEKKIDPKVLDALDGAIVRPMDESDAEIKAALASAVGVLRHAKQRGFALRLCGDRSPALRKAGREALARLDPPGKAPSCTSVEDHGAASPFASQTAAPKKIRLETDVAALGLALDPTWAPITVARIAELAASGFYDGTPIHRVVPGFVVQLGDPGGDGYGGAKIALRCETAPVPFDEGDIGVALAGRDTGSSQIFVMLGRAPHLDGSYSWIGKASGPWSTIAEGDVVVKARVE